VLLYWLLSSVSMFPVILIRWYLFIQLVSSGALEPRVEKYINQNTIFAVMRFSTLWNKSKERWEHVFAASARRDIALSLRLSLFMCVCLSECTYYSDSLRHYNKRRASGDKLDGACTSWLKANAIKQPLDCVWIMHLSECKRLFFLCSPYIPSVSCFVPTSKACVWIFQAHAFLMRIRAIKVRAPRKQNTRPPQMPTTRRSCGARGWMPNEPQKHLPAQAKVKRRRPMCRIWIK